MMNTLEAGYAPPLVLAIDIGSSSARAGLYDAQGRAVQGSEVKRDHLLHAYSDGGVEELAQHLQECVEGAVDTVLEQAGDARKHIAGVAMDTMAATVLGVDADGQPITPIYTYADTRGREDVEALRRGLDLGAVYQRTGCPQHTAYLPARLRWIKRTLPGMATRVCRWVDVGTFLFMRWFNAKDIPASYSIASWSGLLDRYRMQWDEELLAHLDVPVDSLPPLANYASAQRGLASPYASRWPALSDVPFFLAVGDGTAANVGSGCVSFSRVALTVGTSGAMRVLLPGETPEVRSGLWAYRLGAGQTLLGGSLSEGGNVFAWALSTFQLPPGKELEAALQALPPNGHGLTVLPTLAGERSPGWAASAVGTITGLRLSTTSLQVLQGCLEGVSYRFGLIARLLHEYVDGECTIVASGGAITSSPYWLQTMADVLQRPVVVSGEPEATSRGAAILALHALGVWSRLDAVPAALGKTYYPDSRRARVYQEGLERQRKLYGALVGQDAEMVRTRLRIEDSNG